MHLALLATALAAGTTIPAPGTDVLPTIDFDGLPESANVQSLDLEGEPHQVRARLLLDKTAVHAGETVRLGVHLEQKENWHTYWHSPGEVGKPTHVEWDLPEGSVVGDRVHPAPAYFEYMGIKSYGYDGQALHHVTIELPGDLQPGTIELGAKADWLVCEVQCIPGEAELRLPVEVVAPEAPSEDTPWAPLFDAAEQSFPIPQAEATALFVESAVSQDVIRPDDEFTLAMRFVATDPAAEIVQEQGAWPLFTPITSEGWMLMDQRVSTDEDGSVRIEIDGYALENEDGSLPTAQRVGGLFQVRLEDEWIRTEVVSELPFAPRDAEVTPSSSPLFSDGAELVTETPIVEPETAVAASTGLLDALPYLGLALLGGVLLNVMPCVLPVLTLKLYGLIEQGGITNAERRRAGNWYTLGILASFGALALVIIVLQQFFDFQAGWGFQFQYPPYVIGLATIVFAFGLSLFGVFEIPAFGETAMSDASDKEGALGYFLTGAFATLLATPCSAPFLGTGIGFAFSLPSYLLFLFFLVAGLGLALPFLLVAWIPALYRFMPQPGAWMETFKQLLGFTLMATTVWLVDVLAAQTGTEGAFGALVFLTVVGLGCWIFGRWGGLGATARNRLIAGLVAVTLAVATGWRFLVTEPQAAVDCDDGAVVAVDDFDFSHEIPWQPFTEDRVAAYEGNVVFIDFTAEWCLTCKVNERTVLETDKVRGAMAERRVVPVKADWTNRDDTITEWLQRYGKAGVPFYLVVPADPSRDNIALPEVITPDIVIEALDAAS
ncbi:MAG TPA: protein-disulfide reductase DsbD family protein [Myxococcota bacterium]|nr:protein-disulfide reductase DsbD family protein [Myxococcota bacterium]